jgi:hypothetical protein
MKNIYNVCGIFFEIGKKIVRLATLHILPFAFCQSLMKLNPASTPGSQMPEPSLKLLYQLG